MSNSTPKNPFIADNSQVAHTVWGVLWGVILSVFDVRISKSTFIVTSERDGQSAHT